MGVCEFKDLANLFAGVKGKRKHRENNSKANGLKREWFRASFIV